VGGEARPPLHTPRGRDPRPARVAAGHCLRGRLRGRIVLAFLTSRPPPNTHTKGPCARPRTAPAASTARRGDLPAGHQLFQGATSARPAPPAPLPSEKAGTPAPALLDTPSVSVVGNTVHTPPARTSSVGRGRPGAEAARNGARAPRAGRTAGPGTRRGEDGAPLPAAGSAAIPPRRRPGCTDTAGRRV
jgi:hypothetical protein